MPSECPLLCLGEEGNIRPANCHPLERKSAGVLLGLRHGHTALRIFDRLDHCLVVGISYVTKKSREGFILQRFVSGMFINAIFPALQKVRSGSGTICSEKNEPVRKALQSKSSRPQDFARRSRHCFGNLQCPQ